MKPTTWKNCYNQQWAGILIPAAFAHPAKISLALVKKIFAHALENGWIHKGDMCLDPFAGIGGVAFGAMSAGLKFVGQELEPHFVDLANSIACTGISKTDWVQFYERWERVNRRNGRHWCPNCLAQAKQVIKPAVKTKDLFDLLGTASYERNSGKIPSTLPHRFEGNLEFWKRKFGLSGAVILQGDSRRLLENLRDKVECVVSSPPYADLLTGKTESIDEKMLLRLKKAGYQTRELGIQRSVNSKNQSAAYSSNKHNLGNLPAGNFDAVISSPPYAGNEKSDYHLSSDGKTRRRDEKRGYQQGAGCFRGSETYGQTAGQLGAMRDKDFDLVVSSPLYVDSIRGNGNGIDFEKIKDGGTNRTAAREAIGTGYGESPAQLAAMPEGRFDITVSSPPFENSLNDNPSTQILAGSGGRMGASCKGDNYGQTDGQLGRIIGATFWSAAREIVEQCFLALKPGGHAIWVCKNFVRKGKIVEFSQQWARLCEAVGFELVCWHQASLVEVGASQLNVHGKDTVKIKSRKSFFRRLAEKNGSPEINHEDVICFVKPTKTFERLYLDGSNGAAKLKTETVEL